MVTDYDADLARIEGDLADLGTTALAMPTDTDKVTRYAQSVYQHAVHRGDLEALRAAEPVVDTGIGLVPSPGDLHYLKAALAMKLHRLGDVRSALTADPHVLRSPEGRAVLADLDFQEGRYDQARAGYEALIDTDRSWDTLARLAHYHFKMGDSDLADRLFEDAEDELTAKEMRSFSWLELQRGLIDLAHGRHGAAMAHYDRAERAYSGHWMTAEHRAECLGAMGRLDEAAALYEQVTARVRKPELDQGFGELLSVMGRADRASYWLDRALAGYSASADRGEVHYWHHLVDYCADVLKDGPRAVHWARKDIALRDNFNTQAALAWALHRAGRPDEALAFIRKALASGASSAHLFRQAAHIHRAAGQAAEADRLDAAARAINPELGSFHVHR